MNCIYLLPPLLLLPPAGVAAADAGAGAAAVSCRPVFVEEITPGSNADKCGEVQVCGFWI
jgi:hypothetical protein